MANGSHSSLLRVYKKERGEGRGERGEGRGERGERRGERREERGERREERGERREERAGEKGECRGEKVECRVSRGERRGENYSLNIFRYLTLQEEGVHVPQLVPKVYHYDPATYTVFMEYLFY